MITGLLYDDRSSDLIFEALFEDIIAGVREGFLQYYRSPEEGYFSGVTGYVDNAVHFGDLISGNGNIGHLISGNGNIGHENTGFLIENKNDMIGSLSAYNVSSREFEILGDDDEVWCCKNWLWTLAEKNFNFDTNQRSLFFTGCKKNE